MEKIIAITRNVQARASRYASRNEARQFREAVATLDMFSNLLATMQATSDNRDLRLACASMIPLIRGAVTKGQNAVPYITDGGDHAA